MGCGGSKEAAIDLATVARNPAAFVLILSGHHDHPACNGTYVYDGVANGKPQWAKHAPCRDKFEWTGRSWDCVYGPEATVDTPVPPLAGYNKDRGGCDIKVRYQRVTDAGSANGRYPELAGEWRPTRQGQWTRPHQARDRRTVERWDADGRCQYQTEHDIGVIVVVSRMGDEYRCRGESGGARDAPQLIMRTNADGTHSWDLGAWGVEHWARAEDVSASGGSGKFSFARLFGRASGGSGERGWERGWEGLEGCGRGVGGSEGGESARERAGEGGQRALCFHP